MITLTLNPSLDRCVEVDGLAVGGVNRAVSMRVDPGGKGINVARGLHLHGRRVVAVFPVGGADGALLAEQLATLGMSVRTVPIAGTTRSNLTVADRSGVTTKLNAAGPELGADEQDALLAAIDAELAVGARTLVVAGSVPRGVPAAFVGRLADLVAARGARLAVDTSGPALAAAVARGGLDVVKPNEDELAELVGAALRTVGDVVGAARTILGRGTRAVLVSLGARGAVLVTADGTWWAGGPSLVAVSTVGAGDATLAGWLASEGLAPAERLRTAVAWGRGAVLLPGTAMPGPTDVDPASVTVVADPDAAVALAALPALADLAEARTAG